jgi:hypothetical protein
MTIETSSRYAPVPRGSAGRPYLELFFVSFLLLFFELTCIRWFGSTVVFLTFFTNIVLLATFLGMSVGCLVASSRRDWSAAVIPLLLWASVSAVLLLWGYQHFGRIMVDVGGQGSPQQVYFGTEYRARDISAFVIPIEVLAGIFFVLIALVFVGVGQVMGRAFNEAPDRLTAYICNIAGSLAGILAFGLAALWQTTPLTWFAIVGVVWIYFLRRRTRLQIFGLIATVALIGSTAAGETLIWSPYYKILYTPATRQIQTNNIGHQQMQPVGQGSGYLLPHLLNRNVGAAPFENVLIIGAGSGNDVAAALAEGAKHIDAVEIDPAIYEIGRREHPNHPYQDPRVTVHIDDGRSFLRKTERKYDLIVYALVDSLVLHSGYSSLRLESFLFTQEAFDDIEKRLTPNGVFAVYNFFRQGWIVERVARLAEQSFGSSPLVISLPYIGPIGANDSLGERVTFVLASRSSVLATVRHQFDNQQSYWISKNPAAGNSMNRFGQVPPAVQGATEADWYRIAPSSVDTRNVNRVPTDDWPFLYLRAASVPALNIRSVLLLGALSVVILTVASPVRRVRPNWQMFFLGAGFMLLETKGVVHMALLFGSTWVVNSVVFAAILVMILASNLFVVMVRPTKLKPYYVLLIAALVVNILVPMRWFLALPGFEKVVASCVVTFVPIFFAGIVFGTLFRDSRQPDVDFGSNIAGAMLGGFAETLSLVVGFNYLVAIALIFYALSAVSRRSMVDSVAAAAA